MTNQIAGFVGTVACLMMWLQMNTDFQDALNDRDVCPHHLNKVKGFIVVKVTSMMFPGEQKLSV